jgi:hypothetical protein
MLYPTVFTAKPTWMLTPALLVIKRVPFWKQMNSLYWYILGYCNPRIFSQPVFLWGFSHTLGIWSTIVSAKTGSPGKWIWTNDLGKSYRDRSGWPNGSIHTVQMFTFGVSLEHWLSSTSPAPPSLKHSAKLGHRILELKLPDLYTLQSGKVVAPLFCRQSR